VLSVQGPKSRGFLEPILGLDLSAAAFPFGKSIECELGYFPIRLTRVSFVGEAGWELYVPVEMAVPAFDLLWERGTSHNVALAGLHALDSCRIEKKFLHFGHDVADEDTPLEAGVGFVCAMEKDIKFIGYDAIAKQRETKSHLRKRLVQFVVQNPEPLLYHHEPIMLNGVCVGYLTSGNYGHTLNGSVGLGYVEQPENFNQEWLDTGKWEIDIAGEFFQASAHLQAAYDPKALRMRGD